MDIFTILVFFLLVNSSDVEVLPNAKDVRLPDSIAEEKARESVVVLLTDTQLLVQGRAVANVAEVMEAEEVVIPQLKAALEEQTGRVVLESSSTEIADREVTIMGDKEIPYKLLKKVMATCTAADYGKLSLAVIQKPAEVASLAAAVPAG
jgi:biopolymer transport protein ExbD